MSKRETRRCTAFSCLCLSFFSTSALAQQPLPDCGAFNAEPAFAGGLRERGCDEGQVRSYRPRHAGLAYEILDLESEACFVPDSSYRMLDEIIDEVIARVRAEGLRTNSPSRDVALAISRITSAVLRDKGFGLHIPTRTLGDALTRRPPLVPGGPTSIFDCDIGSIILLTIADHYHLPAAFVDVRLASGTGHNYVLWETGGGARLAWDMNEVSECRPVPDPRRPWLVRAMSRDEILSYILTIRGGTWERRGLKHRALADYRRAMDLGPDRPYPFNAFAWHIATTIVPNRVQYEGAALSAAERAVQLERSPGNLDTLACVHAFRGEFSQATAVQTEAIAAAPPEDQPAYQGRLKRFSAYRAHYDCTGS